MLKLRINPYANADFESQLKSQFHTHTYPHGQKLAHELVDDYKNAGYDVLAITDHEGVDGDGQDGVMTGVTGDESPSYPWTEFASYPFGEENRNPKTLNMVAVQGNEAHAIGRAYWSFEGLPLPLLYSHQVSLFNDFGSDAFIRYPERQFTDLQALDEENIQEIIGSNGGISWYAHPRVGHKRPYEGHEDYLHLVKKYKHFLGVEIANYRYPSSRSRVDWGKAFELSIPKPVWGFAVDDSHAMAVNQFDTSWIEVLCDKSQEAVKEALINGCFYCRTRADHTVSSLLSTYEDVESPPTIENIEVDPENKTITINASDYSEIVWVTRYGEVETGNVFSYDKHVTVMGRFVRAEIRGEHGTAFTNPFGFFWEKFVPIKRFVSVEF